MTSFQLCLYGIMACSMLAAAWVDMRKLILPDALTMVVAITGLALAIAEPVWVTAWEAVIASLIAGAVAFIPYELTWRLKKFEPWGFGDVKLFAAAALWLGLENLPTMVLLGCCLTLLGIGLRKIITGQGGWREAVPFGPGLIAGLLLTFWTGPLATWPIWTQLF